MIKNENDPNATFALRNSDERTQVAIKQFGDIVDKHRKIEKPIVPLQVFIKKITNNFSFQRYEAKVIYPESFQELAIVNQKQHDLYLDLKKRFKLRYTNLLRDNIAITEVNSEKILIKIVKSFEFIESTREHIRKSIKQVFGEDMQIMMKFCSLDEVNPLWQMVRENLSQRRIKELLDIFSLYQVSVCEHDGMVNIKIHGNYALDLVKGYDFDLGIVANETKIKITLVNSQGQKIYSIIPNKNDFKD